MKARCNESIKKLITSTDCHLDDGSTVEERLHRSIRPIVTVKCKETQDTVVYDSVWKRECASKQTRTTFQVTIPMGFISEAPDKFDMSKSKDCLMDLDLGQFKELSLEAIDKQSKLIDLSNYHNSLVESIWLGRAVYSWVIEDRAHPLFGVTRSTESHLPEGDYIIHLYIAQYEFTYWQNSDPRGPGSNTYTPVSGSTDALCDVGKDFGVIQLHLVSKKSDPKSNKSRKGENDHEKREAAESFEHLI